MATTLADIAKELGISKMTVSRAINNDPKIKPATRERVLKVARRLKYQPNLQARGLITSRSYLLGLVVPDLMHSYYAEIAKAATALARPAGYEVLICNTEEDPEKELVELGVLHRRTDGLIVASAVSDKQAGVYRQLLADGARIVMLDRGLKGLSCPVVSTDNVHVGILATEHLIKHGHRRIGHLCGSAVSVAFDREAGYRQAMRDAGLTIDERWVRPCGFLEDDGYNAMKRWLAEGALPTAIFAGNDPTAIGAMQALNEARVKVPQEIALVGAGAIHYGDLLRVPLTTVAWSLQEMGQQAAQQMLALLENKDTAKKDKRLTIIKPHLVVRQSCGVLKD